MCETLDAAIDCFRATPTRETALRLRAVVNQYYADEMVGEETRDYWGAETANYVVRD